MFVQYQDERSQINIRQNINSPGHVFYPLTMTKLNTLQATSYFFGEGLSHINHSTYSTKTLGVFLYVYVYILLE